MADTGTAASPVVEREIECEDKPNESKTTDTASEAAAPQPENVKGMTEDEQSEPEDAGDSDSHDGQEDEGGVTQDGQAEHTEEGDTEEDGQAESSEDNGTSKKRKPRRLCRHPGCNRVIKSQGHCQKHGAKAKRCLVTGCEKQAQGTHNGMCKRHWKQLNFPEEQDTVNQHQRPAPEGESVYDKILPLSIAYRPTPSKVNSEEKKSASDKENSAILPHDVMPLIAFLREGTRKEVGWHRHEERRARGLFPISLSSQLETWERQLALVEILLLSGGTPHANFRDLAHAWGRERGFHYFLVNGMCERRGEVERKKRSDTKRVVVADPKKVSFHKKQQMARAKAYENFMNYQSSQQMQLMAQQQLQQQQQQAFLLLQQQQQILLLQQQQQQQQQPRVVGHSEAAATSEAKDGEVKIHDVDAEEVRQGQGAAPNAAPVNQEASLKDDKEVEEPESKKLRI